MQYFDLYNVIRNIGNNLLNDTLFALIWLKRYSDVAVNVFIKGYGSPKSNACITRLDASAIIGSISLYDNVMSTVQGFSE